MFTSKVLTGLAALLALGSYIPGTLATASQIPGPILKDFDNTGVLGALYRPNATIPRSRVAVYVMHAEQDYTLFIGCTELQKRGFTVFCANNAASNLNHAVEDEANLSKMNQSLNVYNPANVFSNGTQSNFTVDFKQRYQKGVVSRNDRILDYAQKRLAAIEAGNGTYDDDEPLTIPASLYVGFNNLYITQDVRTLQHTTQPWTLLRKNGTSRQIINSVRTPSSFDDISNSWESAALKTSVRRYLSTLAVRASGNFSINTDGFQGIEYDSTQMAPVSSINGVSVPLLTMGMTSHYEYLNAEKTHLQAVKSSDAAIAFVEAAQHTINVCTDCESFPGEFGDTVATCFDYVGECLGKSGRFIGARAMSE